MSKRPPINAEFALPPELFLAAKSATTMWPPRMSFDVAMGEDIDALGLRYSLTPEQVESFLVTPAFLKEVAAHKENIVAEGISFKLKAKLQAEEYLRTLDEIIHDPDASPAVRLDGIKSVVGWAGYAPKNEAPTQQGHGIVINIAPYAAMGKPTIEVETVTCTPE